MSPPRNLLLLLLALLAATFAIAAANTERTEYSKKKKKPQRATAVLEMRHLASSVENQGDEPRSLLMSDNARVSSIHSMIHGFGNGELRQQNPEDETGAAEAEIPLSFGAKLQILNYVVTVELGGQRSTMVVDTGSELTWVQCKPCNSCYTQQDPLFDPSNSTAYRSIPCPSSTCRSFAPVTACFAGETGCGYGLSYGDGSFTRGVLGSDRLGLGGVAVDGVIFGCGRSNRGLFGGASGLMGLGRAPLSLISQTSSLFGGVFSYCLPNRGETGELGSSYGSLLLGEDLSVFRNSSPLSYAKMVSNPDSIAPFYFLNLTGISVGGVAVVSPGFSSGKSIIIDSGTVITRLAPSVYRAVRAEFVRQFSGQYPMAAEGFSILDTCFDVPEEGVGGEVPAMRMEFDGETEVGVDGTGVVYSVRKGDGKQSVCLALAGLGDEGEVGIIGNYQQKDMRVVYDLEGSRVGFAEETCGF